MKPWPFLKTMVIPLLLFATGFLLYAQQERSATEGPAGFPLDDSWIHLQFARNWADGGGFSHNFGEPTPGSTAPLWTLLLGIGAWLGLPLPLWAKGLGIVLSLGSMLLLSWLLWTTQGFRHHVLATGSLLACSLPFMWSAFSGLEIGLCLCLMNGGLLLLTRQDPSRPPHWIAYLPLALATQARPEMTVLFLISWLLFSGKHIQGSQNRDLTRLLFPLGLLVLAWAPYVLFCLKTTGRPLANTFYAKTNTSGWVFPRASYLLQLYNSFWMENLLLGLFFPLGLLGLLTPSRRAHPLCQILPLWAIALPLAYSVIDRNVHFFNAGTFGRYLFPVYPYYVVIAVEGSLFAGQQLRWPKRFVWLAFLPLLFQTGRFLKAGPSFYGRNVADIQKMQVSIGQWLKDHTHADSIVATNDVGAIAYFSDRKIVDTAGLVHPDMGRKLAKASKQEGPFKEATVIQFLEEIQPDYLAIFPNWYPNLASSSSYREVHRVEIWDTFTCGGPVMLVLQRVFSPESTVP